jgi:hypothetical protein
MSSPRSRILAAGVSALWLLAPALASAADFAVWAATIKLSVQTSSDEGGFVTRKLGNTEIINLALGRPLKTKIDKNTEVLASSGTYADHVSESKLIVFDPSQNGIAQIKAVVATLTALDFENTSGGSKSQTTGFGSATFAATTLGNPAQNGFLSSPVQGAATGSATHDPFAAGTSKVSGKSTLQGRIRFNYTDDTGTHLFDGIITKGQGKLSGKPIGGFVQ